MTAFIIAYPFAFIIASNQMLELKAKVRTEFGKKSKDLIKSGFLPAVVYGEEVKSQSISVPYKEFEKVFRDAGESTLVKLDVDGRLYNVLIYDIQNDPIKGNPIHADFYAVRMDKEIKTRVPIEFFGESPAVKNEGAVLVKVMQEIEIEALPQDLPHELKADISGLAAFESKLFVKDLSIPEGVKVLANPDEVIAIAETPRSESEMEDLKKAEAASGVSEVKTVREEKAEAKAKEEKEKDVDEKK